MARYTSAYSSFAAQLHEVQLLSSSAALIERSDPIGRRAEINALCRAAIVLLSANVEAYIRELGENALENIHMKAVSRKHISKQFYYHLSKDIIDEIRDTADPVKVANKVFWFIENDSKHWCQAGPFEKPLSAERFNKGFANPKVDKICAYLNRFGYGNYKDDLAQALQSSYKVTINMVDHLVDVRNQIAHGDPTATKPPSDLKEMIRIVRVYCATTDRAFSEWCKNNLCTIR